MKIFSSSGTNPSPSSGVCVELSTWREGNLEMSSPGCASRALRTSEWDCREMRTASADVTHPEQARQSVKEICAGGAFSEETLSSVVTS